MLGDLIIAGTILMIVAITSGVIGLAVGLRVGRAGSVLRAGKALAGLVGDRLTSTPPPAAGWGEAADPFGQTGPAAAPPVDYTNPPPPKPNKYL